MPLSALTVSAITSDSQAMPSEKRRPTRNDGQRAGQDHLADHAPAADAAGLRELGEARVDAADPLVQVEVHREDHADHDEADLHALADAEPDDQQRHAGRGTGARGASAAARRRAPRRSRERPATRPSTVPMLTPMARPMTTRRSEVRMLGHSSPDAQRLGERVPDLDAARRACSGRASPPTTATCQSEDEREGDGGAAGDPGERASREPRARRSRAGAAGRGSP